MSRVEKKKRDDVLFSFFLRPWRVLVTFDVRGRHLTLAYPLLLAWIDREGREAAVENTLPPEGSSCCNQFLTSPIKGWTSPSLLNFMDIHPWTIDFRYYLPDNYKLPTKYYWPPVEKGGGSCASKPALFDDFFSSPVKIKGWVARLFNIIWYIWNSPHP